MPRKWRMRAALLAAVLCAVTLVEAAPPLTVVQDVLYKADGTRFSGVAQIEWKTFQASDGSEIPQHGLTVRIIDGNVRVLLVPTTNALKSTLYTVKFNADGRTQFTEYWAVPPSGAPLRLKDLRVAGPIAGTITTGTTVAIQDVAGLRTELDTRPGRGATYIAGRAAVISSSGAIDSAIGLASDCVKVDGTSGPCGTGGLLFVDGEIPSGPINGSNPNFALSTVPTPASSLTLFRNGVLLNSGSEYTVSSNIITLAAASVPVAGDRLQAWYRGPSTGTPTINFAEAETPAGGIDGVNATFTLVTTPMPASSLKVFRNGLLQKAGIDYDLSVNTIIFRTESVPVPGDTLQVWYRM